MTYELFNAAIGVLAAVLASGPCWYVGYSAFCHFTGRTL